MSFVAVHMAVYEMSSINHALIGTLDVAEVDVAEADVAVEVDVR